MVYNQNNLDPTAESSSWYEDFSAYQIATPAYFKEVYKIPYGSTPLSRIYHPEQKGCLRQGIHQLCDDPPAKLQLSDTVKSVVDIDFSAGMIARQERNNEKFEYWVTHYPEEYNNLMQYKDFWPELVERAKVGDASPADLINLMQHTSGLQAITLGSLSMPYGYRAEYYPRMMNDIEASIKEFGGEVYPPSQRGVYRVKDFAIHYPVRQISGPTGTCEHDTLTWAQQQQAERGTRFSHGDQPEAVLVTSKRKIGRFTTDRDDTPQTTCEVRERNSWVVVCSKHLGFPAEARANLQKDASSDKQQSVREFLVEKIESGQRVSYILPISSSVYAARESDVTLIERGGSGVDVSSVMGHHAFALSEASTPRH